jgi:hypothetical protein
MGVKGQKGNKEKWLRTGIGHGDFIDFIGIKPNLSSTAFQHAS